MSIEEIKRRFAEHQEQLAKQSDINKRMDMRQEFLTQSTESLNQQLAELTEKVDRVTGRVDALSEKVDALSDLTGEIARLVLQHNQRIERLEN